MSNVQGFTPVEESLQQTQSLHLYAMRVVVVIGLCWLCLFFINICLKVNVYFRDVSFNIYKFVLLLTTYLSPQGQNMSSDCAKEYL